MRIFGKQINSNIFSDHRRAHYILNEWKKVERRSLEMKKRAMFLATNPQYRSGIESDLKKNMLATNFWFIRLEVV